MKDSTNKNINTIMVIGNGFDLHCGLKSSFKDYYKEVCFGVVEEFYVLFKRGLYEEAKTKLLNSNNIINFWSFLFYIQFYSKEPYRFKNVNDTHWFDIEHLILVALTKVLIQGETIIDYIKTSFMALEIDNNIHSSKVAYVRNNPFMFFTFLQQPDKLTEYEYLLLELNKFENSFRGYIREISNEHYQDKCWLFLKKMFEDKSRVDLISFNYTVLDENACINNKVNVHGKIDDNEIIIGIDSKDIKSDELIIFTKTYRNIHRLKRNFMLPKDINYLFFYGHSLASADYSYFHSLFDMYNLYDSNLTLNFLYSDYADTNKKNEENHSKYVANIYKLINEYSKEKMNDNNLLHRLLLEGRINIVKI